MKNNLIVCLLAVVTLVIGCTSTNKKEINLVNQINQQVSKSATAYGGAVNLLEQIQDESPLVKLTIKGPEKDSEGWSILIPTEESRLIYVSNSEGDDSSAGYYTIAEIMEPTNPTGITAFKTVEAAMKQVREGYPDWILLKKGDEWDLATPIYAVSGQSQQAPFVITAYGESGKRPLIKLQKTGILLRDSKSFVAVIGLELYAETRDPNANNFSGWNNVAKAFGFLSLTNSVDDVDSILLEDNVFNYCSNNIQLNGQRESNNIIIRRNQILNAYSTVSHSQGVFASQVSMLVEENLFDHNGWYSKEDGKGKATIFNHNLYLTDVKNSFFINNIISRASSLGIKFKARLRNGYNEEKIHDIWIENNLLIGGEVGLSIGGNKDYGDGYRFKNITVLDNVFLNIGFEQPTNRTLAWSIDANDWNGGAIAKNYILYNDVPEVRNVRAIMVTGQSKNIDIYSNVFFELNQGNKPFISMLNNEVKESIRVFNNLSGLEGYQPSRKDISTYMEERGEIGELEVFINAAKQQSKSSWNPDYTADKVNDYLKVQFGR